jgi:hypothetical protein
MIGKFLMISGEIDRSAWLKDSRWPQNQAGSFWFDGAGAAMSGPEAGSIACLN